MRSRWAPTPRTSPSRSTPTPRSRKRSASRRRWPRAPSPTCCHRVGKPAANVAEELFRPVLDPGLGHPEDTNAGELKLRIPETVLLELDARLVEEIAIDLDHQPRGGPPAVDQKALDQDVALGL